MSEEIRIVCRTAGDGIYRAIAIEDADGRRLGGSWVDTRPYSQGHAIRIYWDPNADDVAGHASSGDDVEGHMGEGLFFYLMRRPDPNAREESDDVEGHRMITPPSSTTP